MSTLKVDGIRSNSASSDAITLASDGTCTANITNNLSNRNLIINGAMQVAQRGTSSTSSGYQTVDRFYHTGSGWDEALTVSQSDVASGTTPYTLGFRKALKVQNGNQTSGAGVTDFVTIRGRLEAQDIANSGWNYTSTSSYVTLSFWIKSSVAQNFYGYLQTSDGTAQRYPFETGSLSADTWTKITKKIPGHANLTFNNDNGEGIEINVSAFWGTDYTDSGATLNAWAAYASASRTPDFTSTWYTTNDATFEITGVQLEVGSVATDFEHRSYGDELARCQRYYYQVVKGDNQAVGIANYWSSTQVRVFIPFPVAMRSGPTLSTVTNTGAYAWYREDGYDANDGSDFAIADSHTQGCFIVDAGSSGTSAGNAAYLKSANSNADIGLISEL